MLSVIESQFLTALSVIQKGVVEGRSVVTGFIKPSYIFQMHPPPETDVKLERCINIYEEDRDRQG